MRRSNLKQEKENTHTVYSVDEYPMLKNDPSLLSPAVHNKFGIKT